MIFRLNNRSEIKEDTITWLQIDSAQLELVKTLANTPSDIQGFALAVLEIRGDTTIMRIPEEGEPELALRRAKPDDKTAKVKQSKLSIYPNPAKGLFNIKVENIEGLTEIVVWDLTGRRVMHKRETFVKNEPVQLNLNDFSSGIYFVELRQNGNFIDVGKIINEK